MDNYVSPYDKGNSTRNKPANDSVSRNFSLPALKTKAPSTVQSIGGSDLKKGQVSTYNDGSILLHK